MIIRCAGAFRGHHGGAERIRRRAFFAELRAFDRFFDAFQHLSGDAFGVFGRFFLRQLEFFIGVELGKFRSEFPAAVGDIPDAPPFAVGGLKHLFSNLARNKLFMRILLIKAQRILRMEH